MNCQVSLLCVQQISVAARSLCKSLPLPQRDLSFRLFYRALLQKRPIILYSAKEPTFATKYGVATMSTLLKITGLFCRI